MLHISKEPTQINHHSFLESEQVCYNERVFSIVSYNIHSSFRFFCLHEMKAGYDSSVCIHQFFLTITGRIVFIKELLVIQFALIMSSKRYTVSSLSKAYTFRTLYKCSLQGGVSFIEYCLIYKSICPKK